MTERTVSKIKNSRAPKIVEKELRIQKRRVKAMKLIAAWRTANKREKAVLARSLTRLNGANLAMIFYEATREFPFISKAGLEIAEWLATERWNTGDVVHNPSPPAWAEEEKHGPKYLAALDAAIDAVPPPTAIPSRFTRAEKRKIGPLLFPDVFTDEELRAFHAGSPEFD
jgi:hypothetical protein